MDNRLAQNALDNLSYFCEWGGKPWVSLLSDAIHNFIGTELYGQEILEIGTGTGKIASLLGLLGAKVTGVDINPNFLSVARQEAEKWNLSDKVNFLIYDGNLDIFPDETFDIVFTKSVLVIIPGLEEFLQKIKRKLRTNGKIIFLENAKGNGILHLLRIVHHRSFGFRKARYFTTKEMCPIENIFEIHQVKKTLCPPVYSILGRKNQC